MKRRSADGIVEIVAATTVIRVGPLPCGPEDFVPGDSRPGSLFVDQPIKHLPWKFGSQSHAYSPEGAPISWGMYSRAVHMAYPGEDLDCDWIYYEISAEYSSAGYTSTLLLQYVRIPENLVFRRGVESLM